MKDRPFRHVAVVSPRFGRLRYVRTVAEAGKVLLKEWPETRGKKHAAAMRAVLDSLKGDRPPSLARKALLAAAKEAGMLPPESRLSQTRNPAETEASHRECDGLA